MAGGPHACALARIVFARGSRASCAGWPLLCLLGQAHGARHVCASHRRFVAVPVAWVGNCLPVANRGWHFSRGGGVFYVYFFREKKVHVVNDFTVIIILSFFFRALCAVCWLNMCSRCCVRFDCTFMSSLLLVAFASRVCSWGFELVIHFASLNPQQQQLGSGWPYS